VVERRYKHKRYERSAHPREENFGLGDAPQLQRNRQGVFQSLFRRLITAPNSLPFHNDHPLYVQALISLMLISDTLSDILMVNKQGQTRIAQYYTYMELDERTAMEGEIVRKCLARTETQVRRHNFFSTQGIFCQSPFSILMSCACY
jgi:hypothetical protein